MLVIVVSTCFAESFDIPQEQNTEKNMYVVFSQAGIIQYGQLNLNEAFYSLLNTPLGNLSFGLMGFKFRLDNMVITSMENPEINVQLLADEEKADVIMRHIGFRMSFEFSLLRMAFPYFEDSGTGTLNFNVDSIHMLIWTEENRDCPGAIYLNSTHSSAIIDKIDIAFESSYSFIYDAILPSLSIYLKEFLNEMLSETIVDKLMQFANGYIEETAPLGHIARYAVLATDQRWINTASIIDRQFFVASSGAACILDVDTRYCTGGPALPAHPRCNFMMNADVTYELDANLFRELLAFLWELNSSYLQENFNLSQITIDVVQVVNTGVQMRIEYVKNGEANTIEALAKVKPEPHYWEDAYVIVAYFALEFVSVINPGKISKDAATPFVMALNSIMKDFAFTVLNECNMDLTKAKVVYCDENWIHVGVELQMSQ